MPARRSCGGMRRKRAINSTGMNGGTHGVGTITRTSAASAAELHMRSAHNPRRGAATVRVSPGENKNAQSLIYCRHDANKIISISSFRARSLIRGSAQPDSMFKSVRCHPSAAHRQFPNINPKLSEATKLTVTTCRQRGNFIRPAKEKRSGADGERASTTFDNLGEGGLDITNCARL